MAEPTRLKSNMECIEEAIAKLALNQLNFTTKRDELFQRMTILEPTGTLFKLTQHGSVREYLSQFEALVNHIIGLPTPFLLSCFISRLALGMHCKVQAL